MAVEAGAVVLRVGLRVGVAMAECQAGAREEAMTVVAGRVAMVARREAPH